jgi:uncharacterized OsmC-like protein
VKIILTSEYSIRLEPDDGPMTIEAMEPDEQYSPFHMLASSLAYCTFSVMYSWATHSKQSVDDLVLEVDWKFSDDEPRRVSDLQLHYLWPSLPEKKRSAAQRVAEMCTIHATLLHPPGITIGEGALAQQGARVSDLHADAPAPAAGHSHA